MSTAPTPALPALPADLRGWSWEISPAGTVRLAVPEEGLVTLYQPPHEAVGAILEARAIAVREAERDRQAALALGTEPARVVVAFDYAALPAEARITVQQATKEIRDEYDLMQRSAIKIGRRLSEVKAALPHGSWGAWLESEFGWSQQTATNYMRQAQLAAQNPKFLEFEQRIDPSARTLLADPATPAPARQEALERAEAGERVRHRDAKEIVQAAKAAETPQRPADAPPVEAYEAALIRFATRGYTLSCKARSDGQRGCPPYWIVGPDGRSRGAGTWQEVEARLADLGAAPAAPADPLAAVAAALRRRDTKAAYAAAREVSQAHYAQAMAAVDALVEGRPLDEALALLAAPAPSAAKPQPAAADAQRPSDEEQAELKAIVRALAGSWFGLVSAAGPQSRYRVAFHRERADNYTAAQIRARAAKAAPALAAEAADAPAAPAPAGADLGSDRQPYGAKGADRWVPIVPHVLIIGDRTGYYSPPPLIRAATIYDTPTTVRVRRPDGKEESQTQHKVWAVADDAAWTEIEAANAVFATALAAYADVLRDLGRYAARLEAAGGMRGAPNPLCRSVARTEDPDHTHHSTWSLTAWFVPYLERKAIDRHTPKMLGQAGDTYVFAQADSFVLPDDAAWQRVSAAHQACKDAAAAAEQLLRRIGTYDEALTRRELQPAPAAPVDAVTTRAAGAAAPPTAAPAAADRIVALRAQAEALGYTLRMDHQGLAVMDGAVMLIGAGTDAAHIAHIETQLAQLAQRQQADARAAQEAADQARYDRAEAAARALAASLPAPQLRIVYATLAELEGEPSEAQARSFVAEAMVDSLLALEPEEVAWVIGEGAECSTTP